MIFFTDTWCEPIAFKLEEQSKAMYTTFFFFLSAYVVTFPNESSLWVIIGFSENNLNFICLVILMCLLPFELLTQSRWYSCFKSCFQTCRKCTILSHSASLPPSRSIYSHSGTDYRNKSKPGTASEMPWYCIMKHYCIEVGVHVLTLVLRLSKPGTSNGGFYQCY